MEDRLQQVQNKLKEAEKAGDFVSMLPLHEEVVALTGAISGKNSTAYAVALNDLGGLLRNSGKYSEAEQYFLRSAEILSMTIGDKSADYATVINNMAGNYRLMGNYQLSEQLFNKAIAIYRETVDSDHFTAISAMNNLGLLYQDMGRLNEAFHLHETSLWNLEQKNKNKNAIATTLNNLANLYRRKGDATKAAEYCHQALKVYEKELGPEHPLCAYAYNNLELALMDNGNLLEAHSYLQKTLEIFEKKFGKENVKYKEAKDNLCILEQKMNILENTPTTSSKNRHAVTFLSGKGRSMSAPPKGVELCRYYFEELCLPALAATIPDKIGRMAFGLVGEGSECFGYDDEISQDHDFGPRIMIWLNDDDYRSFGEELSKAVDRIPKEYAGYKLLKSKWGEGRSGVFNINDFYARYTGLYYPPKSNDEWFRIPEENLAAATNGSVFYDQLGYFAEYRQALLAYYPDDVRLKKMAAHCMQIAQSGQYNYPRCRKRNEPVAAFMAEAESINSSISTIYLLNRRYKPFYKWMHRGLKELPILGEESSQLFKELVCNGKEDVSLKIEELCKLIICELRRAGITSSSNDFMQEHGLEIQKQIKDADLKSLNAWVGK